MNEEDRFVQSPLYGNLQADRVVIDPKALADARTLHPVAEIASAYADQRGRADFDAGLFLEQHFELPTGTLQTHLVTSADGFIRGESPERYLVPGSRFREGYYWDTYFTLLLFVALGRTEIIGDVVRHFVSQQKAHGLIPNGGRDYFLTRSQPPVLSLIVDMLAQAEPGAERRPEIQDALRQELDFWTSADRSVTVGEGRMSFYSDAASSPRPESLPFDLETADASSQSNASVFQHLRAGAESGWDFSSRWLDWPDDLSSIRCRDIVPVDLNALLHLLDTSVTHDSRDLTEFNTTFWNDQIGWYFDRDVSRGGQTGVMSLAGVLPLFVGIANQEQAQKVRDTLMHRFLRDGGLVTSLHHTGQQWDAPNGWAPLQYFAVEGLRRYGFDDDADIIANRWVRTVRRMFQSTGQIYEKYNMIDPDRMAGGGEYPVQGGFGWTNGVTAAFMGPVT